VQKRLKLHQFFDGMARIFPTHKHGYRKGSRNLQMSAKKSVFLVLSGKKQI